MPQIWPINWVFLFFLYIILLAIFIIMNYFNYSHQKTDSSYNNCKTVNNSLTWLW